MLRNRDKLWPSEGLLDAKKLAISSGRLRASLMLRNRDKLWPSEGLLDAKKLR